MSDRQLEDFKKREVRQEVGLLSPKLKGDWDIFLTKGSRFGEICRQSEKEGGSKTITPRTNLCVWFA